MSQFNGFILAEGLPWTISRYRASTKRATHTLRLLVSVHVVFLLRARNTNQNARLAIATVFNYSYTYVRS
jgi:hypothetical protein